MSAESDRLLQLIAAGPQFAAPQEQEDLGRPIGVPKAYEPPSTRRTTGIPTVQGGDPRLLPATPPPAREPYYDGSEFGPRILSPEKIVRLQGALDQAGLLKGTYKNGVWDEASSKAYRDVLAYANQGGVDAERALQDLLVAGGAEGGADGLPENPGRVSTTTSSVSLEEQVQAAARSRLGRKLKPSEVSKFASLYQGMETSFNSRANSMQDQARDTGNDSTIEEIASPDAAASQFIDSDFAQEEAGQSTLGYLDALKNLMGA